MEWWTRLAEEGLARSFPEFDLVYHVSLRPAVPPEYDAPGLVGLTFRLAKRPRGGHVYVTVLDVAAADRLGARLGLGAADSLALVDSHERIHVALQVEVGDGMTPEAEEAHSRRVDAVWLSLRHPRAAEMLRAGEFGLVAEVHPGFWERLIDPAQE